MSDQIVPIATYNLALKPYDPIPAINEAYPVSIRISLAALDPEAVDDDAEPSTLRILKKKFELDDYEEDSDFEDSEDELDDQEDSEEEEEEEKKEEKPKKSSPKKSPKKEKAEAKKDDEDDDEDDEAVDEDEIDEEIEEFVVCTLGPKVQYQQTLDLTISPEEEVHFVVTGSYPIHLTGNYISHPYDDDEDDYEDMYDEDFDSEDLSDEDYDLTPDEDEVLSDEELQSKIEELKEEEEEEEEVKPKEEPKLSKKAAKAAKKEANKKRAAEEEENKKTNKKAKKEEDKQVIFDKNLEKGPSKKSKQTLTAGVVVEDRTFGEGVKAKSGNRVGVRYVGKLKNGKVFDKNVKGKPFTFKLGKGEVIRGWDIGIQGMSVGGERRIVIPAAAAYGSQQLPGIPSNSELTFDVKLLSIK